MATIVTIVVTSLLLIFLNLFGNMVEGFYNTLMGGEFQTFDALITFIPNLINGTDSGANVNIIQTFKVVSIAIVMIVLLISTIKSMIAPISGKEGENPANIIVRAIIAVVAIVLYDKLIFGDYEYSLINILNSIIKDTTLFKTSVPSGTLASAWNIGSAVLSPNVLLNMIFYIAILIGLVSAGIIHMERYLSFALFIILGPICIAFYPSNENRNITQEWFKGILAQVMGLLVSLFALSLVGYSLEAMKYKTDLFHLAVTLTLLQFVKNSEKFINMLGFRTMANMDTFRNVMTGVAGLAAISRVGAAAGRGAQNAKDIANKFDGKGNYFSRDAIENQTRMFGAGANQQGFSQGSDGNINKELGTRIADAQSSQTNINKDVDKLSQKDFNKLFDEATIAKGNELSRFSKAHRDARDEAYKAYNARIDNSNLGREALRKGENNIASEQANAAFGTRSKQSQIVGDLHRQNVGGNVKGGYQYIGETLTSKGKDLGNGEKNQELFFVNAPDEQIVKGFESEVMQERGMLPGQDKIEEMAKGADLEQVVSGEAVGGKFETSAANEVQSVGIPQGEDAPQINDSLEQVVDFDAVQNGQVSQVDNTNVPEFVDGVNMPEALGAPQMGESTAKFVNGGDDGVIEYSNYQEGVNDGIPEFVETTGVSAGASISPQGASETIKAGDLPDMPSGAPVGSHVEVDTPFVNASAPHVEASGPQVESVGPRVEQTVGATNDNLEQVVNVSGNAPVSEGVNYASSDEQHFEGSGPAPIVNDTTPHVEAIASGGTPNVETISPSQTYSEPVVEAPVAQPYSDGQQVQTPVANEPEFIEVVPSGPSQEVHAEAPRATVETPQTVYDDAVKANQETIQNVSQDAFVGTQNVVNADQGETARFAQPAPQVEQTSVREEAYNRAINENRAYANAFTFAGKEVAIASPTFDVETIHDEGYDKGNVYTDVQLGGNVVNYGNGVTTATLKQNDFNQKAVDEIRYSYGDYQKEIVDEVHGDNWYQAKENDRIRREKETTDQFMMSQASGGQNTHRNDDDYKHKKKK